MQHACRLHFTIVCRLRATLVWPQLYTTMFVTNSVQHCNSLPATHQKQLRALHGNNVQIKDRSVEEMHGVRYYSPPVYNSNCHYHYDYLT